MDTLDSISHEQQDTFVQNGTDLSTVNDLLAPYIKQYRGFAKAGAEGVIKQCRTLVEVKKAFNESQFERFCEAVRLDPSSSTFRKLMAIGEKADRLLAAVDDMPNSWTTLYKLATLEPDKLEGLVTSGQLTPSMTAKNLEAATMNIPRRADARCTLRIDLTEVVEGGKIGFLNAVKEAADAHGVKLPQTFDELLAGLSVQDSISASPLPLAA